MSEAWKPVELCVGGTQALRESAVISIPQEPAEDPNAWRRRVARAVMPPFLTRLAEQAAGLIMRKPLTLQPKEEGGEVDDYWEAFIQDVDGYGTDLDSFARETVYQSLLFGMHGVLVDFPSMQPAENLLQERQLGLGHIS